MSFLEFADSKLKSFKNTLNSIKLDLNVEVVYNAYRSDKMSASTGYYRVTKK